MTYRDELECYACYTLFDITCNSKDPDNAKEQQRNWNTMLQIIGLRAQPVIIKEPMLVDADLRFYSFGEAYSGLARIWSFEFGIEAKGAFKQGRDPVAALMDDSSMVPMTVGLTERAELDPACILVGDDLRNTYFQILN